jgi:hypothetical protein
MAKGIYKRKPGWSNKTSFKKGVTPWNKGIKQWAGKKVPMLGKKHSLKTREKISRALQGKFTKEKNFAWKGGITPQDHLDRVKFRQTIQKQVLERDDYTCQICGLRGVTLQVDHIQSWVEYVELRFDINNCRTLCQKCHYKITFGKDMPEGIKTWGHNFKQIERMVD